MKKILITILSIFGICFSFCSAEDININMVDSFNLYDSSFSLVSQGNFFSLPLVGDYYSRTDGKAYSRVSFTGFDTSFLSLDKFCGVNVSYSFLTGLYINGNFYSIYSSNYFEYDNGIFCFENLNIPLSSGIFEYSYLFKDGSKGFLCLGYGNNTFFRRSISQWSSYYFNFGFSQYFNISFPFFSITSNSCAFSFYSLTLKNLKAPKFKVNYGNTSYEYELDSDLSIYLKSPVTQNGNTFIYAGSTGLNLFYNGSSQWYNKTELYLKTPSWYNNNIFTPVCM